ncbi:MULTISPECIES: restriction endonuclease [Streptomycetaceae]|uniref:Holliday junction resolvase n=1 Tax=Streptantibioticus cattleyicolor (strain ATCC 35852 / DSM 46488 / JCM 4925 / NBRC 14057 / NRRL 8057) TaxID=1003195 RepID=G8WPD7_STREN|nr:restriction endonuclease [Streptantibioticus cattleyicolor]AEW94638.1 holliday junction resolvase [Streptantibioticus cattleyicolor NRRL 8057 = DSM 46488]MYS59277.1 Holliday junction resolvase [Streptomyces sp. SID5468]
MTRSNYARGRDLEHRVRSELREQGYEVLRTAGSKSKVDLVAIKPRQILFVQCKRSGALPPAEWNALWDLSAIAGAVPVLAEQLSRGRRYWRLTARKAIPGARQPMVELQLDELAGVPL